MQTKNNPTPPQRSTIATGKTNFSSHSDLVIEGYLSRAKEFALKRDYSRAIVELREALTTYSNSAACHRELSRLYFRTNQKTLAALHVKQALAINPQDAEVIEIQQKLEMQKSRTVKTQSPPASKETGFLGFLSKKRF